uniref:Uncharacterized protein n=1 Tax=Sphaerodactylus townsendi TaxID=933632 RepID=A0ACB8FXC5_9SAUR
MAERNEVHTTPETSTTERGQATGDEELRAELRALQQLHSFTWNHRPHQKSDELTTPFRTLTTTDPGRGPQKGFKVEFNGDRNELAFFLIQVGSYMEVCGDGFRFEDPLVEEKAWAAHQQLRQGNRSVSDFATEFLWGVA